MSKRKPVQNQTESAPVAVPPVAVDVPVPESVPAVQDAPKEGAVVLTMAEEAKAEFGDILAFEQSRMTRWARIVKVHCVVPEDWNRYESLVKGAAVEYLAKQFGFKVDLPRASWPEAAAEQWKGRFAPMFSNMSRIGKGLLAYEKKQVVAILEDTTKSYNAKLAELPRDNRGNKKGNTRIAPSATMTEGKQGESKNQATGQANAQSLAATQLAAAVAGFTATCKAIENMNDSYIYGMLQAVAKKLDAQLAPEWLNLSPKIKEACTEYDKRKVAEAKKKDGKTEDSIPPEVESEPVTTDELPEAVAEALAEVAA